MPERIRPNKEKIKMLTEDFKAEDAVYYYRKVDNTFDTIPATILKVNPKTLLIRANFPEVEKPKVVRVSKASCEKQI